MAEKRISYTVRDFQAIRTELINFVKTYYPDLIDNFNDASVFSAFLDLNAAVTDNLQFNIDRSIQETVLQYAQQKSSIYNIAKKIVNTYCKIHLIKNLKYKALMSATIKELESNTPFDLNAIKFVFLPALSDVEKMELELKNQAFQETKIINKQIYLAKIKIIKFLLKL